MFQYTPYILPLLFSASIILALAIYAWQFRTRAAALSFTALMLAGFVCLRYYDLRISPLYGRRKKLSGRLIVLRDISERKQAEEALQASEDRIRSTLIAGRGQRARRYHPGGD